VEQSGAGGSTVVAQEATLLAASSCAGINPPVLEYCSRDAREARRNGPWPHVVNRHDTS